MALLCQVVYLRLLLLVPLEERNSYSCIHAGVHQYVLLLRVRISFNRVLHICLRHITRAIAFGRMLKTFELQNYGKISGIMFSSCMQQQSSMHMQNMQFVEPGESRIPAGN